MGRARHQPPPLDDLSLDLLKPSRSQRRLRFSIPTPSDPPSASGKMVDLYSTRDPLFDGLLLLEGKRRTKKGPGSHLHLFPGPLIPRILLLLLVIRGWGLRSKFDAGNLFAAHIKLRRAVGTLFPARSTYQNGQVQNFSFYWSRSTFSKPGNSIKISSIQHG